MSPFFSLAKQVSEKETELEDLRSQFYTTQTTLTSAQKEIEGYRKRAQQEELQIAEVKMMMHQVRKKKSFLAFIFRSCKTSYHFEYRK